MRTANLRKAMLAGLFLALVLSGCGGQVAGSSPVNAPAISAIEAAQPAAPPYVEPTAAPMPSCAQAGPPIPLPARFPNAFPMPPGTVLTSEEVRSDGVVVTGIVPASARDVAIFFKNALVRAGITSDKGDSEPGEAEAEYAGQGYVGRWKIKEMKTCPGAATLTVFAGH